MRFYLQFEQSLHLVEKIESRKGNHDCVGFGEEKLFKVSTVMW